MPKTNRDMMKRIADHAINDLDRCLDNLGWLRNIYAGGPSPKEGADSKPGAMIEPIPGMDHPEYREAIEAIAGLIVQAHDVLQAFRTEVM